MLVVVDVCLDVCPVEFWHCTGIGPLVETGTFISNCWVLSSLAEDEGLYCIPAVFTFSYPGPFFLNVS